MREDLVADVLHASSEHEELDDKAREKAARDAATGKLRVKRRDRGIGFEDSDSDEGSDDGRRARPANKKPRLNDSIAALCTYLGPRREPFILLTYL